MVEKEYKCYKCGKPVTLGGLTPDGFMKLNGEVHHIYDCKPEVKSRVKKNQEIPYTS